MSKTIKQIADELGVSKTAVRKKMTPEVQTKFAVMFLVRLAKKSPSMIF